MIQSCPPELLGSKLQYAMVRLSQLKPNQRMRDCDICNELAINLLTDQELVAYVFGAYDNGVLDIKLYETTEARRPIYNDLIKKKFYRKV